MAPPNHAIRIEPLKKIARSLRQHRPLILNYFRAKKTLSSGVVEGLNNKAKVYHEKIPRLSHVQGPRTCPLPLTWQATRSGIDPRFLLTNRNSIRQTDPGLGDGCAGGCGVCKAVLGL